MAEAIIATEIANRFIMIAWYKKRKDGIAMKFDGGKLKKRVSQKAIGSQILQSLQDSRAKW
ncbi:MAG: hypothetical protein HDT33_02715 [Clostridiales bacterium]|nr:hypothetical protein [Clostridiales bacterium]